MSTAPTVLLPVDGHRVRLYSTEFTVDPHNVYRKMREQFGSLVPVELAPGVPATLVIGYRTALRILNDPDRFPVDPRTWEASVPPDCPVLPVFRWRPNASRNSGAAHERLRQATTAAVEAVDLHGVIAVVGRTAVPLINGFCAEGSADLVSQYAFPLVYTVVNTLLGCPPEISAKAASATASVFDAARAADGERAFEDAVRELIEYKRGRPGTDLTTSLLGHPARLSEEEILHQVLSFYGVGMEPVQRLISNALRLMLTDERFGGGIVGGSLSTRDAIDEVLFSDPPLPNACVAYPRRPVLMDDVWLPAHQPVVISLAGCNDDPEIVAGEHAGNRAHLAWGAGPHACPAKSLGYLIAQCAIDQLLDALPDLQPAVAVSELTWRPGPMHRTLTELPVTFEPSPPLRVV
ncbi:MAG TPA: cytochrome P450 [Nocardia sp.]|uniref:cytochrome P450 n=1 Tax=Nocardia sp. TaxID=1821 RepID=UPI002B4AF215|nr:cytochrome P450 [Nocardia sp.]HLS76973.1 cytochrome P450 [Nocardia sp.]